MKPGLEIGLSGTRIYATNVAALSRCEKRATNKRINAQRLKDEKDVCLCQKGLPEILRIAW